MQDSHRQLILPLLAIFTLLQLVVLLVFGYTPYPDSEGYILLAQEAIEHGEPYPISSMLFDYPFLWNAGSINAVALSLVLFHSVTPLLILYALMKGATAWLFYLFVKRIVNEKVALLALLIYMLYPANYGEATSTLSELPFLFFIMLGLWLSLVKEKYLLGGMMLALANWFRPMGFIFLAAIVIYLLVKRPRKLCLLPIVGYVAVVLLIGTVSYCRTGLFLYQAKTGWMALTDYSTDHSPETMAVRDNQQWNVAQKDSAWQALFLDWVQEHPADYIKQMPQKLVNTYVSDNVNMCTFVPDKNENEYMYEEVSMGTLLQSFPHYSLVQWLTVLNLIIYYVLLICGLLSLFFSHWRTILLPGSIIALGTLLLLFVGHGEARFHIPFMPFIIMMATLSLNKLMKR